MIFQHLSQLMRLWYLSHRQTAKAQASLRIYAVSPQPSLFAHKVLKYTKTQTKNQTSCPIGWLRMSIWRMSLRRTKSTIISWDCWFMQLNCQSYLISFQYETQNQRTSGPVNAHLTPGPGLPTPISPTLKFYLTAISLTLVFCAIHCLLFMEFR